MKKGSDAPQHLLFRRAIKKRRQRAIKRKNPTVKYKFVEMAAPAPVVRLSWWRRLLKFLHIV